MIYYGELQPALWISNKIELLYHFFWGILVLLTIMTLKTTDRKGGFKATPLDFILLFVAIVLPNLPDDAIRNFNINFLAAKIIIFFLIFEVLIGEMRRDLKPLKKWFVAILGGVVVKIIIIL
jgi:UDP-GlcNAc:undecaprenyl-phosphate GlcNAc-1-phosphate transferase